LTQHRGIRRFGLIVAFPLLLAAMTAGHAVPLQWAAPGGNGHWYDVVSGSRTWEQSRDAAAALSYSGLKGHLATFTSASEWAFYTTNMRVDNQWLGGFQPAGSPEPAGNWQWVTGEAWTYAAWNSGEPNNLGGENALMSWNGGWYWNDLNGASSLGMVVEYEASESEGGATPELSTWALLCCTGLFGAGLLRRRRRA
jgi:hypothetical protein